MKRTASKVVSILTVAALVFTGCGKSKSSEEIAKEAFDEEKAALTTDFSVNYDGIAVSDYSAKVSVHDPSIVEFEGTYYIYGSHRATAKTTDFHTWETVQGGAAQKGSVYYDIANRDEPFVLTGSPKSPIRTDDGTTHIWAPDVKYSAKAGKYYMYFCTSSNYYSSTVCYATSDSPDGPFEWKGNIVYSGYDMDNIKKTNVLDVVDEKHVKETYMVDQGVSYKYNNQKWPNCIDPTIFWDKDGRMWMTYGSWSGGIFLLEIDETTGEAIRPKEDVANNVDPYYGKRLIGGGHTSIEGPYILYDNVSGYYYLFVSYGALQRSGGYQIRVFRSETPDGNYVDMNGQAPQIRSGNPVLFGLKMTGNYMLPSLSQAYMATGHNSAMVASDGKRYIAYHTRFEKKGEFHEPRVHQYFTNEEGWPCMLPYMTDGETISETGYTAQEIAGEYYVINQGSAINADIAEPIKLVLTEKGNVFGKGVTGTWEQKENSYFMHINYDGKEYSGVFCKMNDEAGTACMTFSAVGNNQSIWGVKY